MKLEQAARQLLSVLESGMVDINAITALREALGENNGKRNLDSNSEHSVTGSDGNGSVSVASLAKQAEQEPVAWMYTSKHTNDSTLEWYQVAKNYYDDHIETPLYAAPVRTKDLTDAEIHGIKGYNETREMYDFAHAVIRAYKEKQK